MTRGKAEPEANRIDLDTIAIHEAGHAVMRWLRGLPATELTASDDGGLCGGTGREVRRDHVLYVLLGGPVVENGYGIVGTLDFARCGSNDFERAKALLAGAEDWLCRDGLRVLTIDEALAYHFDRACDLLCPHIELVDAIGGRLAAEGRLSARRVAALCREYGRRLESAGTDRTPARPDT